MKNIIEDKAGLKNDAYNRRIEDDVVWKFVKIAKTLNIKLNDEIDSLKEELDNLRQELEMKDNIINNINSFGGSYCRRSVFSTAN
mgnify:CR=1 FL=1